MGMLRSERIGIGLAVVAAVTSVTNLQAAPSPDHVMAVWSAGPAILAAAVLPQRSLPWLGLALGLAVALAYAAAGFPGPAVGMAGVSAGLLCVGAGWLLRREVGLRLHDAGDLGHLLSVTWKVALASAVQGLAIELLAGRGAGGLMPLSHAALASTSLLALLPLVADLPRHPPVAAPRERRAQGLVTLVLVALAVSPAGPQVLSLLLLPTIIAWGALRGRARIALLQAFLAMVAVMLATLVGSGGFVDVAAVFGMDAGATGLAVVGYAFVVVLFASSAALFTADQLQRTEVAAHQRDLLQQVLDATPGTAIVGMDGDGLVTHVNVGVRRLLGHDRGLLGQHASVLYAEGELARLAAEHDVTPDLVGVAEVLARSQHPVNLVLCSRDGERREHQLTFATLRDAVGAPRGFLATSEDVTELMAANRTLAEALERQNDLEEAKDAFVATVSHELRTPLTSILGNTELVADMLDGLGSEEDEATREVMLRGALARMERGGRRLSALIDDLLAHTSAVDQEPGTLVDLAELVHQVCNRATGEPESGRLAVDLPAGPLHVVGRRDQLARALGHVVDNAIKFSPDLEPVQVRARQGGHTVEVEVLDRGIGIPPEEIGTVMARFARGSNAVHRQIQGAGLGLGLARSVLVSHGGSLELESTLDVGTTARMRLPARAE